VGEGNQREGGKRTCSPIAGALLISLLFAHSDPPAEKSDDEEDDESDEEEEEEGSDSDYEGGGSAKKKQSKGRGSSARKPPAAKVSLHWHPYSLLRAGGCSRAEIGGGEHEATVSKAQGAICHTFDLVVGTCATLSRLLQFN